MSSDHVQVSKPGILREVTNRKTFEIVARQVTAIAERTAMWQVQGTSEVVSSDALMSM